jgi:hypothetical protein
MTYRGFFMSGLSGDGEVFEPGAKAASPASTTTTAGPRKDRKTPALRLGLAAHLIEFDELPGAR